MNGRSLSIRLIITVLIIILTSQNWVFAEMEEGSGEYLLSSVSSSLDRALGQIDKNLTEISGAFGTADMKNTSVDNIISPYQMNQNGIAGVILMAGNTIYPSLNLRQMNTSFDTSLLQDPAVQDSIKYINPKMSQEKKIGYGNRMVMISRPAVVDDHIGAAVAILIPDLFCDAIIQPQINDSNTMCIVMQLDGTILYASHPEELTKIPPENFHAEFTTFRDVKTAMTEANEGHMKYGIWRADPTDPKARDAYWNTIYLHGTGLRVLVAVPVK